MGVLSHWTHVWLYSSVLHTSANLPAALMLYNVKRSCQKADVHPYSIIYIHRTVYPFWKDKWMNHQFRANKITSLFLQRIVLSCVMLLMQSDTEIQGECLLSTSRQVVYCVGSSYWISSCQTWFCHMRVQMFGSSFLWTGLTKLSVQAFLPLAAHSALREEGIVVNLKNLKFLGGFPNWLRLHVFMDSCFLFAHKPKP